MSATRRKRSQPAFGLFNLLRYLVRSLVITAWRIRESRPPSRKPSKPGKWAWKFLVPGPR